MNIKDKSLHTFFGIVENDNGIGREINPHNLLKDEIILKKREDLPVNTDVIFEVEDFTATSRKKLISIYTYAVSVYDDVSVKLVLINFSTVPA